MTPKDFDSTARLNAYESARFVGLKNAKSFMDKVQRDEIAPQPVEFRGTLYWSERALKGWLARYGKVTVPREDWPEHREEAIEEKITPRQMRPSRRDNESNPDWEPR